MPMSCHARPSQARLFRSEHAICVGVSRTETQLWRYSGKQGSTQVIPRTKHGLFAVFLDRFHASVTDWPTPTNATEECPELRLSPSRCYGTVFTSEQESRMPDPCKWNARTMNRPEDQDAATWELLKTQTRCSPRRRQSSLQSSRNEDVVLYELQ